MTPPTGVRFLPPLDPYLLGDRNLVVPDRAHQRLIWRPVGNPGVVWSNGRITGIWRHRRTGRRLMLAATAFAPFDAAEAEREAGEIAGLRGLPDAALTITVG